MASYTIFAAAPANLTSSVFFQPGALRGTGSPTGATYANPSGTFVSLDAVGATFDALGKPTGGTVQGITLYAADFSTQLAGFSGLSVPLVVFDNTWLGPAPSEVFALLLAGADVLGGGAGDDTLTGHAGDDAIDGGGGLDIATYGGARADYTIKDAGGGVTTIAGLDGTDTLSAIRYARFSDGLYALAADAAPAFVISADQPGIAEGTAAGGVANFTVRNTGGTMSASTIEWSVSGGGATASDFAGGVLPSGSLVFNPGETSRSIAIALSPDSTVEADEAFTVAISQAAGDALFFNTAASTTIINDDSMVSIAPLAANHAEGTGGPLPFTFKVSYAGPATGARSVKFAVAAATVPGTVAAAASDFIGGLFPSGTVDFAPGETSRVLTIAVNPDVVGELNEAFAVTLSDPSDGAPLGVAKANGIILNDDTSFRIASASGSGLAEGTGVGAQYSFTITRSGNLSAKHSVSYGTAGSGVAPATAADFAGAAFPGGTVQFGAGEAAKTIIVPIFGDSEVEANQSFAVTLSAPTGGAVIAPGAGTAVGTILNDDATLSIAALSSRKSEGTGGTTAFTFTVTRGGNIGTTHSAKFFVAGASGSGTAPAAASDFVGAVFPAGVVSFAPGETKQTVTVSVNGDAGVEFNERFAVTLATPSAGATLGTATAEGIVYNDDSAVSIAALDAKKPEDLLGKASNPFFFTVTRSGNTSRLESASWNVAGLSRSGTVPANAADFLGGVLPSGTVTFAPGVTSQIISIPVAYDITYEPEEAFRVTLSAPTGGTTLGGVFTADGVIQDDDGIYVDNGNFVGTSGSDVFVIRAGNAAIFGGGGVDKFLFASTFPAINSNLAVQDFNPGIGERLDLTRIDANIMTVALNEAFTFLGSKAFTGTPGELRYVPGGSGNNFIHGDRNGDMVSDFAINVATATKGLVPTSGWMLL